MDKYDEMIWIHEIGQRSGAIWIVQYPVKIESCFLKFSSHPIRYIKKIIKLNVIF